MYCLQLDLGPDLNQAVVVYVVVDERYGLRGGVLAVTGCERDYEQQSRRTD